MLGSREGLERLATRLVEMLRHGDLDGDEQITGVPLN